MGRKITNKLSCNSRNFKPNQSKRTLIHYLIKASGDLIKGNYFFLPYNSDSSLLIALINRDKVFKIYSKQK
jgi:hypothetical protein